MRHAASGHSKSAGAAFANDNSTSSSINPPTVPPFGSIALVPVMKNPASGISTTAPKGDFTLRIECPQLSSPWGVEFKRLRESAP